MKTTKVPVEMIPSMDDFEQLAQDSEDEPQDLSEAEELFESMCDTIASLFRLAVIIRNASPRDRFSKALSGRLEFDAQYDVAHVAHKYPKLDDPSKQWLKERLGKAITQRRQYLRYARDHREKLGKAPKDLWSPSVDAAKPALATLEVRYNDIGGSQAARTNTTRPTLTPTSASTLLIHEATFTDQDFREDQSQTSFAQSVGENEEENRLHLPCLSDVSRGQVSFECPLCWTMQSFRRECAWRKHAFSDLRPYICTFGACDTRLFTDRRAWVEHEMTKHRARFHCPFCRYEDSSSTDNFRHHVRSAHTQDINDEQLGVLVDASMRPIENFAAADCPFCDTWERDLRRSNAAITNAQTIVVTPPQFVRHVGSHMQDLALFAIPRGYLEGDTDGGSLAGVGAASLGRLSTSNAPSSLHRTSSSSRSSCNNFRCWGSIDIEACAKALELSSYRVPHEFEEVLVYILPALDQCEVEMLSTNHRGIMDRVHTLTDYPLRLIATSTLGGRWGANGFWLASGVDYSGTPEMWLNMICRLLVGRTNRAYMDLRHHSEIGNWIDKAINGSPVNQFGFARA